MYTLLFLFYFKLKVYNYIYFYTTYALNIITDENKFIQIHS